MLPTPPGGRYLVSTLALLVLSASFTVVAGALARPAASSSPGVVAVIDASRTECVSPCTVVFSAERSRDLSAPSLAVAFHQLGYHFDFDDPTSGVHSTTGLAKNTQIGAPLASHTFRCDNGASCEFDVGVRAQRADGAYDDAFIRVPSTTRPTGIRPLKPSVFRRRVPSAATSRVRQARLR